MGKVAELRKKRVGDLWWSVTTEDLDTLFAHIDFLEKQLEEIIAASNDRETYYLGILADKAYTPEKEG